MAQSFELGQLGNYVTVDESFSLVGIGTSVNISGILSATSFIGQHFGNITGNVNGNINGNVNGNVNSSGISTLGIVSITELTTQQINVSGVSTFNNIISSGSFSGGGILIDTTNISGVNTVTSTHLITQRLNASGVTINAGIITATTFNGSLTGNVQGNVSGNVTGNLNGTVFGNVNGSVTGTVNGNVTGTVNGNVTGNLNGNVNGNVNSSGISTFSNINLISATVSGGLTVQGTSSLRNKIEIPTSDGFPARIELNSEQNTNFVRLQASPQIQFSGSNAIITLPAISGTVLLGNTASPINLNINTSGSITGANLNSTANISVSGIITSTGGANLNGGMLREKVNIVSGSLNDNANINLVNGMVHQFSSPGLGVTFPNIRFNSTTTLNSVLDIGQGINVVLILPGNNLGWATTCRIDGFPQTTFWLDRSVPGYGNTNGFDIYTYNIIKTSITPTYIVLANRANFAA